MKLPLNYNGESGFTLFQSLGVLVVLAVAIWFGVGYVAHKANRAAGAIGRKYTNDLDKVEQEFFIFHDEFNVSPVQMDIPESALAKIGQWRFFRSTDLVNWSPVASLWTDELSAQMFVRDLFQMETNIAGMNLPSVYFSATLDSGDQ